MNPLIPTHQGMGLIDAYPAGRLAGLPEGSQTTLVLLYFVVHLSSTPRHPLDAHSLRPVDTREMPAGALIEGKAKRYKAEDGPEAVQAYSAMTVRWTSLTQWACPRLHFIECILYIP